MLCKKIFFKFLFLKDLQGFLSKKSTIFRFLGRKSATKLKKIQD